MFDNAVKRSSYSTFNELQLIIVVHRRFRHSDCDGLRVGLSVPQSYETRQPYAGPLSVSKNSLWSSWSSIVANYSHFMSVKTGRDRRACEWRLYVDRQQQQLRDRGTN